MDQFRELLEPMLLMQGRLDQGHFRKQYQAVAHIAHGWLMRCTRGSGALLAMYDAGFEGEVAPLQRSILEHVVALRWLLAEGDRITAPLRTVHGRETEKLRSAMRNSTDASRVDEEMFAAVLISTEHDDHGRDNFHQFAERARAHGNFEDILAYQGLVMETHATFQSAVAYWDFEAKQGLELSRTEGDPVKFAACYLHRALAAYSGVFIAPPWRAELAATRARMVKLDPDLDMLL